jgi:hypothetical protein
LLEEAWVLRNVNRERTAFAWVLRGIT